ncbi:MAG: hypothetical protein WDM88_06040 [Galbitalea sp.]
MQGLEAPVGGGHAATQVGAIHDVVVHERRGVEQFEPGRHVDDAREVPRWLALLERIEPVSARPDRVPAPVSEQGAEPLAPAQKRRE